MRRCKGTWIVVVVIASVSTPGCEGEEDGPTPELVRDFAFELPLFSPTSPWNQPVAGAAVLPQSGEQVLTTYRVLRGDTTGIVPEGEVASTWPFPYVASDEYSVPVFRASEETLSISLCDYEGVPAWPGPDFEGGTEGGPIEIPAPAGDVRPSGPEGTDADGHLVLFDPEALRAVDLWQATTAGDDPCRSEGGGLVGDTILGAGAADLTDVSGDGLNPDGVSSARASGAPLLAGLILPEDVEEGEIRHALALSIPRTRNTAADPSEPGPEDYFSPASTTEVDFYNTDPSALASGQRLRLAEELVDDEGVPVDESSLPPVVQMVFSALRTYGAYVVDNAGSFTFYAEDPVTARLTLDDGAVAELLGRPYDVPLPEGNRWSLLVAEVNAAFELIPVAFGPWSDGQDPATATIEHANFEVVEGP